MTPAAHLQKAQAHLEARRYRRAVEEGWRAANDAFLAGDADILRDVITLADDIAGRAEGRVAKDARQLGVYCRNSVDGSGETVESSTVLARISRIRQPRKTCPDCAEKIAVAARVCRYCGFRFEDPLQ